MASSSIIILTTITDDFLDFASLAKLAGTSVIMANEISQIDNENIELLFNPVVLLDLDNTSTELMVNTVERIQKQNIPYFFTATEIARQVFDDIRPLKPMGYFLKPLSFENCALNIAQTLYSVSTNKVKTQKLEELFVKNGKDYIRISAEEILWVQASGNYIEIFTSSEKSYLLRVGLKDIEERLPDNQFIRVHKSYIVNKRHILKFNSHSIRTVLGEVPLARSYFNAVIAAFTVI